MSLLVGSRTMPSLSRSRKISPARSGCFPSFNASALSVSDTSTTWPLLSVNPIAGDYQPPSQLGPDQRKALAHVLTSPDQFTGFRGLAGSGKSTALAELDSALAR